MIDWLIFLGKLPFILIGISFVGYLAWMIIIGFYGLIAIAYLKIRGKDV
jgi:hypothetical protein